MAILYVSEKAKALLEKMSISDRNRPVVDIVDFIVEEKAKQLGILADANPSSEALNPTNSAGVCQVKNGAGNAG